MADNEPGQTIIAQSAELPGFNFSLGPRGRALVEGTLLLALVWVAYLPALKAGFIWDDPDYVTDNVTLYDLHGLRQIWFEPSASPQYYPLTLSSFWLEYHI